MRARPLPVAIAAVLVALLSLANVLSTIVSLGRGTGLRHLPELLVGRTRPHRLSAAVYPVTSARSA